MAIMPFINASGDPEFEYFSVWICIVQEAGGVRNSNDKMWGRRELNTYPNWHMTPSQMSYYSSRLVCQTVEGLNTGKDSVSARVVAVAGSWRSAAYGKA